VSERKGFWERLPFLSSNGTLLLQYPNLRRAVIVVVLTAMLKAKPNSKYFSSAKYFNSFRQGI